VTRKKAKTAQQTEPQLTYTIFDNVWPKKKNVHAHKAAAWSSIVKFIREQEKIHYTDKKDCPLISLCRYGTTPSPKGYMRHAANVKAVYGIELDYDDGEVRPDEAAQIFKEARVKAVIYTSPSHKADYPKWRALLPLSKPVKPDRRSEFVGMANQLLDGIVARESFTLSQSFYVGHVRTAEYLVYETHGRCIDELDIKPRYPEGSSGNGESAFDATPDDEFLESYERGEGRYDATLALSSRWIAKGRDPEKVREELKKYVYLAEQDGVAPTTEQGENLYKLIDRLVDSASSKFKPEKKVSDEAEEEEQTAEDDFWLSIEKLESAPSPQEFVIDEWLTMPNVGLYSAHGGSGKSYIALEISVRVALGVSVFGKDVKQGKVFYFSAEDDGDAIHRRVRHIVKAMGVPMSKLDGKLFIRDATRDDTVLFCAPRKFGEDPYTTPRYRLLRKLIKEHDPVLVILDNAVDHYDGDENNRVQVRTFIRKLFKLAQLGSGRNILLLAHVDAKSVSDGEKAKGFSGSTAWHNSVRNLWYQWKEEDGDRQILQLKKINYGAPGARVVTQFDTDKMTFDIGKSFRPSFARFERRILEVVRNAIENGDRIPCATSGPRTAAGFIRDHALCPSELRQKTTESKRVINEALMSLVKEGALKKETFKHSKGKSTEVFVLGPAADTLFDE